MSRRPRQRTAPPPIRCRLIQRSSRMECRAGPAPCAGPAATAVAAHVFYRHVLHRHLRLDRPDRAGRDAGRGHRRAGRDARAHRAPAQSSVGAGGRGRQLGDAGIRPRVLAAGADLGLCRFSRQAGDVAMIVVLLNLYIAILVLFVWLRFIPFNTFWKISPVIVLLLLLVGLFIPMGWGAPSGPVAVIRNAVQIVPSVAGEVVDVPVAANVPLKQGDVLFRIDPTTYDAQVQAIAAQLKLQTQRLAEMTQLQTSGTGRTFDVEQRQADTDNLKAQLDGAKWNLDKTTVVAPADGY